MDDENQNNVSSTEESDIQESNNQSMVNSGAQKVANASTNKLKSKITEKATKEASKAAVKKSAMLALSHVMFYVIIFLVIIIVLVGIAMFFVTVPGMVMDKLKSLGKAIGNAWAAWFGKSTDTFVERKQVYGVMDYIEQMSYGLKEHGFLTHYLEESDKDTSNGRVYLKNKKGKKTEVTSEDFRKENEDEEAEFDEEEGVYRSSDTGKIIAGCSDFIMQYIISDNYMYTIRNFNLDTNWWTAIFDHIAALFGDDMSNRKGMIYLIHDTGSIGTINYNFWRTTRCI